MTPAKCRRFAGNQLALSESCRNQKSSVSGGIWRAYNPALMLGFRRDAFGQLENATTALRACVQRLETERAALRARLEGDRQLRIFTAHIAAVAQMAPVIGGAIERFAAAMRAPLPAQPRGRAGGLARATSAWRYFDGTFMLESEKDAAYIEEYERYAAGGRARAGSARRGADGTFQPNFSNGAQD